jgi:hypothetical protein
MQSRRVDLGAMILHHVGHDAVEDGGAHQGRDVDADEIGRCRSDWAPEVDVAGFDGMAGHGTPKHGYLAVLFAIGDLLAAEVREYFVMESKIELARTGGVVRDNHDAAPGGDAFCQPGQQGNEFLTEHGFRFAGSVGPVVEGTGVEFAWCTQAPLGGYAPAVFFVGGFSISDVNRVVVCEAMRICGLRHDKLRGAMVG